MNPAALKTNLRDLQPRRHPDRQRGRLRRRRPGARPATQRTRSKTARSTDYRLIAVADDQAQRARRSKDCGLSRQGERTAARTSSRWASSSGSTSGRSSRRSSTSTTSSARSRTSPRPTRRRSRPATTTAKRPSCSTSQYQVAKAKLAAGHVPQDHRQRGPRPAAWSPRPTLAGKRAVLRQLPDHAGQRHPARARRATRTSASAPSRPRTKSRPSARRSAPRSAARWASPAPAARASPSRAEAIGLAVMTELPLRDRRRAARRARAPACRRRPSRPTCSRPCSAATASARWPIVAAAPPGRLLRRGDRSLADRRPVHDARRLLLTDGYIANGAEPWRIPDVATCRRSRSEHRRARTTATHFLPYKRDERAGAPVGDPRHARPRAPHRRPREAGHHRQRQLRARATTSTWSAPAGREGRQHRRGHPPTMEVDGRRDAATCSSSAGAAPTARCHGRAQAAAARAARAWRTVHLRYLNPLPSEPRRAS